MKKYSILILAFLLILALTATSYSEPNNWAKAEVDEARSKGLLFAEADQNFQDYISRELFCKLIVRVVEQQKGEAVQVSITNPFNDTANEQIVKAFQLGIVKGVSTTQFAPQNLITRQEVAVMMMRAFRVLDTMNNKTLTQNVDISGIAFNDEASIANWALQDVKEAFKLNLVKGVGNNTINPLGNTTVEQSILLALRLFNNYQSYTIQPIVSPTVPIVSVTQPSASEATTESQFQTELQTMATEANNPPPIFETISQANQQPQPKSDNLIFDMQPGTTIIQASDIAVDPDGDPIKITKFKPKNEIGVKEALYKLYNVKIVEDGKLSVTKYSNPLLPSGSVAFTITVSDNITEPVKITVYFK